MFGYLNFKRWSYDPSKSLAENEKELRGKSFGKRRLAKNLNNLSRAVIRTDPQEALRLMSESLRLVPDISRKKWYGFRLFENGFVIESYTVLDQIPKEYFVSASEKRMWLKISSIYKSILPLRLQIAEIGKDADSDNNSVDGSSSTKPKEVVSENANADYLKLSQDVAPTWSCDLSMGFSYAESSLRKSVVDKNLLASYLFQLAQIAFDKYPDDALRCVRESVALNYKDYRVLWHVSKLLELQRIEEACSLLMVIDSGHLSGYQEIYTYNTLMGEIENSIKNLPSGFVKKFEQYQQIIDRFKESIGNSSPGDINPEPLTSADENQQNHEDVSVDDTANAGAMEIDTSGEKLISKQSVSGNDVVLSDIESVKSASQDEMSVEENGNEAENDNFDAEQQSKNEDWVNKCRKYMADIRESNGCKYYKKYECRIGIVSDVLFYNSLSPAADFVYLTRDNYLKNIKQGLSHLFFVSTWKGFAGVWEGLASSDNEIRKIALDLISQCKSKKIPVVFIYTGELSDYEIFKPFAGESDFIFASTNEILKQFNEDYPEKKVFQFSFSINPLVHNPIGLKEYGFYQDCRDFYYCGRELLLNPNDGSGKGNIDSRIFDLFDGIKLSGRELKILVRDDRIKNYDIPKKYYSCCYSSPDADFVIKLPKISPWVLKNKVSQNNEAIFDNTIYELSAEGALIVSRYSFGMNCHYPFVNVISSFSEIQSVISAYSEDEYYYKQINNVRIVYNHYTCFDCLNDILTKVGSGVRNEQVNVLVVCPSITERIQNSFDRQTWKNKKLMLMSDLSASVLSNYQVIAFFSDEFFYEGFYLEDMINAFKYTDSSFITKDAYLDGDHYIKGVQNDYVSYYKSLYSTIFWISDFKAEDVIKRSFVSEKGYSADHFSLIRSFENFGLAKLKDIKYKFAVIIPVYNNGVALFTKGFDSLRRSSMFEDIEIILVDDCSSDSYTIAIENYLVRHYSNVHLYRFTDYCSGSASRPRNKGIELATAPYITFLDPDDMACEDGYRYLYDEITETGCDICVGNAYCQKKGISRFNYFDKVKKVCSLICFEHGLKEYLPALSFMTVRIHAMMIKSSFLKNFKEKQIEGALGQDSLLALQMLSSDVFVRFIDNYVQIYYANVENSVTNTIDEQFFKKLLKLQPHKLKWLNDNGLLKEFMDTKFKSYTMDYLFKKLVNSSCSDEYLCEKLTFQIIEVFLKHYNKNCKTINVFLEMCKKEKFSEIKPYLEEYFQKKRMSPKGENTVNKVYV